MKRLMSLLFVCGILSILEMGTTQAGRIYSLEWCEDTCPEDIWECSVDTTRHCWCIDPEYHYILPKICSQWCAQGCIVP